MAGHLLLYASIDAFLFKSKFFYHQTHNKYELIKSPINPIFCVSKEHYYSCAISIASIFVAFPRFLISNSEVNWSTYPIRCSNL